MKLRNIKTVDQFNGEASEILEKFALELIEDKECYYLTQEEKDDMGLGEEREVFVYTKKAQDLLNKMSERLVEVGKRHFPNEEEFSIKVETEYFRELI